jgi:hypothetical protein
VVKTHNKTNFRIELEDVLNTWIDKNPKSRYMKHGYRSVVRKWMTPEEVVITYGDFMTQEEINKLPEQRYRNENTGNYLLITGQEARCGAIRNPGMLNGVGVHPIDDYTFERRWDLIPVYEVEWIDSKKKDGKYVGTRYNVTRIGGDLYILDGEDDDMLRDADADNEARLSLNGVWYTNGHGAPYSLMLATAHLQDTYDLLIYKKDNLVALSGTAGAIVDVAQLPEMLGNKLEDRLLKYQALRKIGLAVIDTSQEGGMQ